MPAELHEFVRYYLYVTVGYATVSAFVVCMARPYKTLHSILFIVLAGAVLGALTAPMAVLMIPTIVSRCWTRVRDAEEEAPSQ